LKTHPRGVFPWRRDTDKRDEHIRKLRAALLEAITELAFTQPGYADTLRAALDPEPIRCVACQAQLTELEEDIGHRCAQSTAQCAACEGTGYAPGCDPRDRERGDLWQCVICLGTGHDSNDE